MRKMFIFSILFAIIAIIMSFTYKDEIYNNEGRETQHTTLEWQRLATDFGNGINLFANELCKLIGDKNEL